MKDVWKILLAALIFSFICGCSTDDDGITTIRYMAWGAADHLAVEQVMIDRFEELHPHIKVKLFMVPASTYHQKLQIMLASRSAPDVMRVDHYYFPALVRKDYFIPLDEFIENDADFELDDFFPQAIEEGMYDGKLYGLNVLFGGHLIYYNKDLFREEGIPDPYELYQRGEWTMDKFIEVAKIMTKRDANGRPLQFGSNMPFPWYPVWAHGGSYLCPEMKTCTLDTPEAIAGLQWMKDLRWKHRVTPTLAEAQMAAFTIYSGRIAMMFAWSGHTPIMLAYDLDFEWDIAPVPEGPAGRFTNIKGNQLLIYEESRYKEAAWEFLKFMVSPETEMYLLGELRRALPTRKSVAEDPKYLEAVTLPTQTHVFPEQMGYGRRIPINENYHQWFVELQAGLERMWINEMEAEEMVKWVVPRINRALAQDDW